MPHPRNISFYDLVTNLVLVAFGISMAAAPTFTWYGNSPSNLDWMVLFCGGTFILLVTWFIYLINEHRRRSILIIALLAFAMNTIGFVSTDARLSFSTLVAFTLLTIVSVGGIGITYGGILLIREQLQLIWPKDQHSDAALN